MLVSKAGIRCTCQMWASRQNSQGFYVSQVNQGYPCCTHKAKMPKLDPGKKISLDHRTAAEADRPHLLHVDFSRAHLRYMYPCYFSTRESNFQELAGSRIPELLPLCFGKDISSESKPSRGSLLLLQTVMKAIARARVLLVYLDATDPNLAATRACNITLEPKLKQAIRHRTRHSGRAIRAFRSCRGLTLCFPRRVDGPLTKKVADDTKGSRRHFCECAT